MPSPPRQWQDARIAPRTAQGRLGLRVAIVTTFYPPYNFGGDGQYVRRFAHALAAHGHQVEIIHESDAFHLLSDKTAVTPAPEPDGVIVHRLKSAAPALSCLATQQFGSPLVQGRRIKEILSRKFDVIHYHNISLVGGPGVLRLGEAVKIYTAHEHWLVCPMHILWKDNREPCNKKACFSCSLRHGRPPQLWRYTSLLKKAGRHVDAFLALSEFSAQKHKDYGFPFPMRVMASFLPEAPLAPLHESEGRPYFLMVGRLEAIKGFQDVISLFDDATPADLLIAGDGNYGAELRRLAAGKSNIKFLGPQSPEKLRALYRGARALIAPSRCYEVFPLVLLEAFQQETPAIARDLGPYPEIIKASKGGVLFHDDASLRQAIFDFINPDGSRDAMGRQARQAFELLWSEKVALKNHFDLVEGLKRKKLGA